MVKRTVLAVVVCALIVGLLQAPSVCWAAPTISVIGPSVSTTSRGPVSYTIGYQNYSVITLSNAALSLTHPAGSTADGKVGVVESSLNVGQRVPAVQGDSGFTADKYDPATNQWERLTPYSSGYSPYHYKASGDLPSITGRPSMPDIMMHPGNGCTWAVLSYQAPVTGTYTFNLNFANGEAAPGCTTRGVVFRGSVADAGSTLAAGQVRMGQPVSLSDNVPLQAGEYLRIAIDPQGDITSDTTVVTGTITTPAATGSERTVCVWHTTGDGNLGVQIAAGTAADAQNNLAEPAAGAEFTVDSTAPSISVNAPLPTLTSKGAVSYTVHYGGYDAITLSDASLSLTNPEGGTATGRVGVVASSLNVGQRVPAVQGDSGFTADKYDPATNQWERLTPYSSGYSPYHYKASGDLPSITGRPSMPDVMMHPGNGCTWAVLSYQAPMTGTYTFNLNFANGEAPPGCTTRGVVFKGSVADAGSTLAAGQVRMGQPASLSNSVPLQAGEYLRIAIDPQGDITSDTTVVTGTITTPAATGDNRTVCVWHTTGDGALGVQIAAGTAADAVGNLADPAAGTAFTVHNPFLVDAVDSGSVHNGATWDTAYVSVQDAIDAASAGDEIWVKAGTYTECINMKSGVRLLGGFDGDETASAERDWVANATILDGTNGGNSVVTIPASASASTEISGFTITNGQGKPSSNPTRREGGGIYCGSGSAATICYNKIVGNCLNNGVQDSGTTAGYDFSGAGIYAYTTSSVIASNIVAGNGHRWWENGAYVYGGSISYGGGIRTRDGDTSRIVNNTICRNMAQTGAGMYISSAPSSQVVANNIVTNNLGGLGYGIYRASGNAATLANNCAYPSTNATYPAVTGELNQDPRYAGNYSLLTGFSTSMAEMDLHLTSGDWQTYSCTYSDQDGYADIDGVRFIIRQNPGSSTEAYFSYSRTFNRLWIYTGGVWVPTAGVAPGTSTIIESQDAYLDCAGTTISQSGNNLTVNWRVRLKGRMAGKTYNLGHYVTDVHGASNGDWYYMGTTTAL